MKTKLFIAALIVMSFLAGTGLTQPQQRAWEYKFEYKMDEKKANNLGSDGWELAAIESPGPGIANNVPTYVFKRLK